MDDKKLVNKGWYQMSKTLDQVMPQKKKRRFSIIWLGLFMVFSIILFSYGYHQSTSKINTPKVFAQSVSPTISNSGEEPFIASDDQPTLAKLSTPERPASIFTPDYTPVINPSFQPVTRTFDLSRIENLRTTLIEAKTSPAVNTASAGNTNSGTDVFATNESYTQPSLPQMQISAIPILQRPLQNMQAIFNIKAPLATIPIITTKKNYTNHLQFMAYHRKFSNQFALNYSRDFIHFNKWTLAGITSAKHNRTRLAPDGLHNPIMNSNSSFEDMDAQDSTKILVSSTDIGVGVGLTFHINKHVSVGLDNIVYRNLGSNVDNSTFSRLEGTSIYNSLHKADQLDYLNRGAWSLQSSLLLKVKLSQHFQLIGGATINPLTFNHKISRFWTVGAEYRF